jgi:RNA polymerase-binding transcription factor DksA
MLHVVNDSKINRLQEDKQQIERDIQRLELELQAEIDPNVDEGDPGLTEHVTTIALLENARRKVEEIQRAIDQAESGGYGQCEVCGQAIDPERLEIFPEATLCVACKEVREGAPWLRRLRAA